MKTALEFAYYLDTFTAVNWQDESVIKSQALEIELRDKQIQQDTFAAGKAEGRVEREFERINSLRHLNRLATWAQQDPTGPWEKLEIQKWVLDQIRAAIEGTEEPSPTTTWEPKTARDAKKE